MRIACVKVSAPTGMMKYSRKVSLSPACEPPATMLKQGDLQDHGAQVAGQVAEGLAQRNALSPGRSLGGGKGHTKDCVWHQVCTV